MRYGVTIFGTDQTMNPVEVAVEAEACGFDSFWLPEHTHIPLTRKTPPPTGDAELPTEYKRSLDPLVTLAAIASLTSTIRLGTGVLLPAQREPIVTAKAIATLCHLSNERFVLGAGFGWNQDEIEQHNVDFATRREVAAEHLEAMRALWASDEASFFGDHIAFGPSWSWPKPRDHVPVLLGGGDGPKLMKHLVDYCDGWIPVGGAGLGEAIPRLHELLNDAGRNPASFEIVPFGSIPDISKLQHFAEIGVTECVFRLPAAGKDQVQAEFDRIGHVLSSMGG